MEVDSGKFQIAKGVVGFDVTLEISCRSASLDDVIASLRGLLGDSVDRLIDRAGVEHRLAYGERYKVRLLPHRRTTPEASDLNEWPQHLVPWIAPTAIDTEGRFLEGEVRCPCGGREVTLWCRGETEPLPRLTEFTGPDGGAWWDFEVAAACASCGTAQVLFDRYRHGWEALAGSDAPDDTHRPPLRRWVCGSCGGGAHRGTIRLVRDHILDFLERVPDSVEEDYRNGFTWFAMDIQCCGCGHRTDGWVDYECR
ncbi:MAG: hypothetical protein NZ700_03170 [Gemmataceae bacterium]|nr:hypothetical protein [Gemmataceae bacterium]MDW8265880.1 hypothetical protein [Gemmataceae bacterium]